MNQIKSFLYYYSSIVAIFISISNLFYLNKGGLIPFIITAPLSVYFLHGYYQIFVHLKNPKAPKPPNDFHFSQNQLIVFTLILVFISLIVFSNFQPT